MARVVCVALLAVAVGVPAASAGTIAIGPNPLPPPHGQAGCGGGGCSDPVLSQLSVDDPNVNVAAPYDGTIVAWRVVGGSSGGAVRLRVLSPAGAGAYTGGAVSAPATSLSGMPNAASLPIRAGDHIGVQLDTSIYDAFISRAVTGGNYGFWTNGLANGTTSSPPGGGQLGVLLLNADLQPLAPAVTGLSPTVGKTAGGETVAITGSHLGGSTAVSFGGTPATTFSVVSDTQITATAPPHAPGNIDVVVTGPGGDTSTPSNASKYAYLAAPVISHLAVSPTQFAAAKSGPATTAASTGTRVTYTQSENGATLVTFQGARSGHKRKHSCLAPTAAPHGKHCTRWVTVPGHITITGHTGKNTFRFTGRLNGKALKPGRYRLVARATDATGNKSTRRHTPFRILR